MQIFSGSRYNALHIAARSKNDHAAKRVLELVGDVDHRLFHRLYPEDPYRINERRRLHPLDCYLNTPDKSLNETPLHFASKLGCASIVERLVSYKECQKEIRNKYVLIFLVLNVGSECGFFHFDRLYRLPRVYILDLSKFPIFAIYL